MVLTSRSNTGRTSLKRPGDAWNLERKVGKTSCRVKLKHKTSGSKLETFRQGTGRSYALRQTMWRYHKAREARLHRTGLNVTYTLQVKRQWTRAVGTRKKE